MIKNLDLDILFVNCYSYEFFYIPLGTFGLCDYLSQQGFRTKILNLANHSAVDSNRVLSDVLDEYAPRYVGLILHWKELFSSFLKTGAAIKGRYPDIKIVAGGLTAGYYARELVTNLNFIDYVIRGDAEIPLRKLLQQDNHTETIENIVYKQENGSIIDNRGQFLATSDLLNTISFSGLDYLIDYDKYIQQINKRLGFVLSIGRGCEYNCQACGGSKFAFSKHSDRSKMILRDPNTIIQDIERLYKDFGVDNFLISHVNEIGIEILELIQKNNALRGKITINLESWGLPSEKLLNLYRSVSHFDSAHPGILHMSPETMIEADRMRIKDRSLFYTNEALYKTIDMTMELFDFTAVGLFFSYPNASHDSLEKLETEFQNIQVLKTRYAGKPRVRIYLMTLSSDPGSILNENEHAVESSLNLANINQAILFDRTLSSNMLYHRPTSLSTADLAKFEKANSFDEIVSTKAPYVYQILVNLMGYGKFREIIHQASGYYYYDLNESYYPLTDTNTALALNLIKRVIQHGKFDRSEFIFQLLDLFIAYEIGKRLKRTNTLISEFDPSKLPEILTLNNDKIFIAKYQFMPLINEIQKYGSLSEKTLLKSTQARQPTLYLFLNNTLIALEMSEYEMLRQFNGLTTTSAIIDSLSAITGKPGSEVHARLVSLYQEGLLI